MTARSFVDTNVLVYTDDRDQPAKQARALDVVEACHSQRRGVVSTQVLQEYFVTATAKLGVASAIARRKVELFAGLDLVLIQLDDILGAADLQRLHRLSFWDGLIVRAAQRADCKLLLTEDLQHGRRFDGLEVVNPFL